MSVTLQLSKEKEKGEANEKAVEKNNNRKIASESLKPVFRCFFLAGPPVEFSTASEQEESRFSHG